MPPSSDTEYGSLSPLLTAGLVTPQQSRTNTRLSVFEKKLTGKKPHRKTHTMSTDRIPFGQKLAFSASNNTDFLATQVLTTILWLPFFNIGLGMDALTLSAILVALRIWNAVTDLAMGTISDNARTRWGRRRPFMLVGAFLMVFLYPLFWLLPNLFSPEVRTAALTVISFLFFTSFTVWAMPYYALQLELTPDYDERTRLTAWMTFFVKLGMLAAGWILSLVFLVGDIALNTPGALGNIPAILAKPLSALQPLITSLAFLQDGDKPIVAGMKVVGWLLAVVIFISALLPPLFVKERYYKPGAAILANREPFFKGLLQTARDKPLWLLIGVTFMLVLGNGYVETFGNYVNFYYVCQGDLVLGSKIFGLRTTLLVITGIATIPPLVWLGEKLDKRTVLLLMLGTSVLGHLASIILVTPEHPYWQILPGVTSALAVSSLWLYLPSMKADVADHDELRTGARREGSINAFYSWFVKVALALAMLAGGLMLRFAGFDPAIDGAQPAAVSRTMFHHYLIFPALIWSGAMLFARFYPLTRAKCAQIRTTLESRRGVM